MGDPYRSQPEGLTPAPARRTPLREAEWPPLPLVIRVRGYSDGTTRLRFGKNRQWLMWILLGLLGVGLLGLDAVLAIGAGLRSAEEWRVFLTLGLLGAVFSWPTLSSLWLPERVVITPAALLYRSHWWRRATVVPLDDVSTIVVSGRDADARVDVQLGRRTVRVLGELRYPEETLRWCAQRLRKAIDHARAARQG